MGGGADQEMNSFQQAMKQGPEYVGEISVKSTIKKHNQATQDSDTEGEECQPSMENGKGRINLPERKPTRAEKCPEGCDWEGFYLIPFGRMPGGGAFFFPLLVPARSRDNV